jgi:hypothetical protein
MTRKIELGQFMLFAGIPAARGLVSRAQARPGSSPHRISSRAHRWHVRESGRDQRKWEVGLIGAPREFSDAKIERRSRGLDLNKAKPFNDRSSVLARIDPATSIKLAVPQMEKLGLLRTTSARSRTVFTGWYLPIQATWSSPAALST